MGLLLAWYYSKSIKHTSSIVVYEVGGAIIIFSILIEKQDTHVKPLAQGHTSKQSQRIGMYRAAIWFQGLSSQSLFFIVLEHHLFFISNALLRTLAPSNHAFLVHFCSCTLVYMIALDTAYPMHSHPALLFTHGLFSGKAFHNLRGSLGTLCREHSNNLCPWGSGWTKCEKLFLIPLLPMI